MRRTPPILLAALLSAMLAGCGGGGGGNGGGSSSGSGSGSPLINSYTGPYSAATVPDSGTWTMRVDDNLAVTGTVESDTTFLTGTLAGTITTAGAFTGTLQFPGQFSGTVTGTLTQQSDGRLTGTLQRTLDGVTADFTVTLLKLF